MSSLAHNSNAEKSEKINNMKSKIVRQRSIHLEELT